MADEEKSSLLSEQSLKDSVSISSSKTEINGEKAYEEVANLSEDDLRDFLNCVSTGNKGNKDNTNNKTSTIAQILLERETAVLREESGSGDDSPDSSKQNQLLRSKPRHSSARLLHNRYGSQSSHRVPSSCSFDSHYGKTSAAARNTAGSLGSLHDLSNSDARSSGATGSSQHSSSHKGSSKGSHGGGASKCCVTREAGQEECVGVSRPPPLRTYSRVRTGGSCGNLSRSSFDTQPPGRSKRCRRNKGADPASTSTREGGSLQNLSKAECCGEEEQKGLQKSGSLSQVFTEETAPPKHKSRRRKASSETQQSHHRASEERSLGAPDSSSDDDDDRDVSHHPYRPLSPHHSPVATRRDAAAAVGGGISSEHSGCASRASSISSHDEAMSAQVEEMRRCAYTTTAASAAAEGAAVDAAAAAACLGAAVSGRPGLQDPGEELLEVVSHIAHRDTVKPTWLQSSSPNNRSMAGRRRSTSPHSVSAAVDAQVPFFSRSSSDRHNDAAGKNSYGRSHSIESNAYSSKSTDERGSEREKLQSQRSEPSQLGRRKDSAIDCPSPPSHSYSTGGSPHCTFLSGSAGSSLIVSPGDHRERDHGIGRTSRFKPGRVKKKRQQEVQTVDTSAPSYKGDQDIGSILLYLGEESADVSAGDGKKKKKKQDGAPNKKDDRKESGKKGASTEVASKKIDDGKDDHKKEDSGGGGGINVEKKKKHKEDRKNSAPLTEEDELGVRKMKKEVIEKELKKNGIITPPSSLDSSVVSNVGTGGDCNKSSLEGNSLDCDNTSSVRTNVESSKTPTSVSDKESKTSVRKHPDDKAGLESSNRSSSKKNDDRKQNTSATNSEASVSKRSKKSGKENQGIRASSGVEDLVSKCRMSEQMSQGSKQTTVDDGAMTKKRQQKSSRRNATESTLPSTSSSSASHTNTTTFKDSNSKDRHRRTVDDIRVKSGASKSSGGSSSLSNSKKLSKRLSSSNSNLNSTTKSSEFGRDFYEAGDPYIDKMALKDVAVSDTNDEFELVTRRKNRKKFSPASGGNISLISSKSRIEDAHGRDGYREFVYQKSISGRTHHGPSSSNTQTKIISGGSSHVNSTSYAPHSTDSHFTKSSSGGKKPPINFDEAPRTPHDGSFMARLSANNSGDRNTATSAPNSDCSDSDGDDSVHSMPTPSTTPRPEVRKPPSSSGATPQTSYANIARLAGPANRNQVKRMTSAPQTGRTSATANTSSTSTSSNSTSGGYSAAACATSDQSLLTTNAWPCLSSVGGAAHSGAATSAPAIPSVVRWASSSSSRQNDPQYVAPTFGSPPRLTSAAIAAHDSKPQNILHDNFPPLKSPSYPSFNHRQTSIDSETGLSHAPHHGDAFGKADDVTLRLSSDVRSGNTPAGRASFSSDKESSPTTDKNVTAVTVDRNACNKSTRSSTASDVSEKKTSKENRSNRISPPNRTMNGHENIVQNNGETNLSSESKVCPQRATERILKQTVCNTDQMKATRADPTTSAPVDSSMSNISIQADKIRPSKTNNKSKDAKRRQYDPVVFADSLQLDDIRNSNLTFMFASNEDLTDLVVSGPNVTANNLVNSTVSLTKTGSKISASVDTNGNPVIRARKSMSGEEVDTPLPNFPESGAGDARKKSRDSSCSSNCTIIDATSGSAVSTTEACNDCARATESGDASHLSETRSPKINVGSPTGDKDLRITCAPDSSHLGVTFHAPDADDPVWNFTEAVCFIRNNWKKIERALQEGDKSIVTLDLNSLHSQ